MRLTEILPRTFYATAAGECVRVIPEAHERIEPVWMSVIYADSDETMPMRKADLLKKKAPRTTDPWVHVATGREVARILVRDGVRVEKYPYDAAGRPDLGAVPQVKVVRPQDIMMLWDKHLALHADKIADIRVREVSKQTAEAMKDLINSSLDKAGVFREWIDRKPDDFPRQAVDVEVDLSHWTPQGWDARGGPAAAFSAQPSITFTGAKAVNWVLERLFQPPIPVIGTDGKTAHERSIEIMTEIEANGLAHVHEIARKRRIEDIELPPPALTPVALAHLKPKTIVGRARHQMRMEDLIRDTPPAVVRKWAMENGLPVRKKGQISLYVAKKYWEAHFADEKAEEA